MPLCSSHLGERQRLRLKSDTGSRTEFADQKCLVGVGSPLAVDDISILVDVEAKLLEALGMSAESSGFTKVVTDPAELLEPALGVVNLLDPALGVTVSCAQGVLEGRQPGVELNDAWKSRTSAMPPFLCNAISPVPSAGTLLSPVETAMTELAEASLRAIVTPLDLPQSRRRRRHSMRVVDDPRWRLDSTVTDEG